MAGIIFTEVYSFSMSIYHSVVVLVSSGIEKCWINRWGSTIALMDKNPVLCGISCILFILSDRLPHSKSNSHRN